MIEKRSIFFWHLVLLEITKGKKRTPPISFASFCLFSYLVWKLWAWDCELLHDIQKEKKIKSWIQGLMDWSGLYPSLQSVPWVFWGGPWKDAFWKWLRMRKLALASHILFAVPGCSYPAENKADTFRPSQSLVAKAPGILTAIAGPRKLRPKMLTRSLPAVLAGGKAVHPTAILCL